MRATWPQSRLCFSLGPEGSRLYRTASFDLERDVPIEQDPQLAPPDAILIVDGTFLQRSELGAYWDATVFVQTSEAVSEARGIGRDAGRLGGTDQAQRLYAERYRPAFHLYERLCVPETASDAIVFNDDLRHPRVHFRPSGRLVGNG